MAVRTPYILCSPTSPPFEAAPSLPALSSFFSLFSFFLILPAEHLPAGHSISFLVLGE